MLNINVDDMMEDFYSKQKELYKYSIDWCGFHWRNTGDVKKEGDNLIVSPLSTVWSIEKFVYGNFEITAKLPFGSDLNPTIYLGSDYGINLHMSYGKTNRKGNYNGMFHDIFPKLPHLYNVKYGIGSEKRRYTDLLKPDDFNTYGLSISEGNVVFKLNGNIVKTIKNDEFNNCKKTVFCALDCERCDTETKGKLIIRSFKYTA